MTVSRTAPPVYSMDEAAKRLHKSRRWLQDWLRGHPLDAWGQLFYSPLGRTKTFDDGDLERIRAAAREEERCRLSSNRRVRARPRSTTSAVLTSESVLTDLRKLLTREPRGSSSSDGKPKSSAGNIVTRFPSRGLHSGRRGARLSEPHCRNDRRSLVARHAYRRH